MELTQESSAALISIVANIEKSTAKILKDAYLSKLQRTDLEAILNATRKFQTFAQDKCTIIDNPAESEGEDVQRVRHELLNHLNIIVGFTKIMVRDLPDNLLLQMVTIREINETGQTLIERVKAIR